jgi:AcrR family transcriptional regulator
MNTPALDSSKRSLIIRSARRLFAERRFDAVSVPEIVKLAGVAQGTFYRYFTSKNALIDALSEELGASVAAAIRPIFNAEQPFSEQLEPILRAALEATSHFQDILGFLNTDAMLFAETPQGEAQRAPFLQMLAQKLEHDQTRGYVRKNADVRVLARLVDSALNRMARDCLVDQIGISNETYLEQTVSFLQAALAGDRAQSSNPAA